MVALILPDGTRLDGDIPLSHAFTARALPDGTVMLDSTSASGDDGEIADLSAYYRLLSNGDFTAIPELLVNNVTGTGSSIFIGSSFQAWGDPVFDTYPLVSFGAGDNKFHFSDGFSPVDLRVGRTAAGVFAANIGLIRADELGGASKDSAFHLARANHTGTQLAATISDFAAAVAASPPASHVHSAADITTGLLDRARGGTGADGSSLSANLFLGSPSGGAGAALYRALAAADIPSLDAAKITSGTLARARLAAEVAYEDEANVFTASSNKFEQLLRVGSQTAGTGLVIGSQSAVLDAGTLTNNIGLTIYADSTSAPAALNYANPNVGAAAGLSQQFLMVTDTGSYKRALVIQVDKNNGGSGTAWLNSDATKQNVVYRLRMLKGGATADSFRIDSVGPNFAFGGVNSYGGGLGVIHVADRTTAPTSAPTGGFLMSSNAGVPTFRTSGNKIVNLDQGAAVSPASGGATIDAEARTAINAVITRLQDRGLLA